MKGEAIRFDGGGGMFVDRVNELQPLSDTDPMPFGKHRGLPMQDVPTDYLHYLWFNMGLKNSTKTNQVAAYIELNINALRQENPDLIWT